MPDGHPHPPTAAGSPDHTSAERLVVVGPPRSGTTLLASLLAQLGVNFGVEQRDWDINSGYYEHPDLLKLYGQLRKAERFDQVSDNLARRLRQGVIHSLAELLRDVKAIKYPPISVQLPYLIARAGYRPVLAISARRFEPYAISRMRMEGVGYGVCKRDYLETYQSALLQLQVYRGEVIHYEGLLGPARQPMLERLGLLSGAPPQRVAQVVEGSVGSSRSGSGGGDGDPECLALYERLVARAA